MNISNQLKNHILFTEYNQVRQLCNPLSHLGIVGFIYMRHFPDRSFIDLSNQLEWSNFFLTRYFDGLYKNSVVQDHMFIEDGISLWNLNEENIIWQEGQKYFGFGNGISLAFKKKGYSDVFCFYAKKENYLINQFYLNHIDLLKQFCAAFLENAVDLIKKGYRNKLITPSAYFAEKSGPNHSSDCQRSHFQQYMQAVFPNFLSKSLTKRQLTCIEYTALGYSAQLIAEKLFISKRTVEDHLEQAKIKLECKNLPNLVYRCTKHNLID